MSKLQDILEYKPMRRERGKYAEYLWAVYRNKTDVIEKYEALGDHVRQILLNIDNYDRGLLFGFTERGKDEYGWLEKVKWLNYEQIEFYHKGGKYAWNSIRLGMGLNGKWAYTTCYSFGAAGGSSPLSEYSSMCESRNEAIVLGLKNLIAKHEKALTQTSDTTNYKETLIKEIIQQTRSMLSEMTNPIPKQISLFDL